MKSALRRMVRVSCLWSSRLALMMSLALTSVSQAQLANTQIAFIRDGIFIANIDGTNLNHIFTGGAGEPSWSPDRTKIAFHSGSPTKIYVVNADGTNLTQLTTDQGASPSWSPDGTKIAFSSSRNGGINHIYVMNADGTNQTPLTAGAVDDSDPAWSPDGTRIAFHSFRNSNWDIYVMNAADGSDTTRLTTDPAVDQGPSWSPDGTQITFFSTRISGQYDIYRMNAADGSDQTRLTTNSANDYFASWAPDGTKIVFESTRDGGGIYVMNAIDGSDQTRIITPGSQPAWSPFLPSNQPPVANAGSDQTLECTSHSGAPVTLNGAGSSDPDGDALTFTWTGSFGTTSGPTPTVTLSLGIYTVTLTVSDGQEEASDQVMITIQDITPPVITLNGANPLILECPASYVEPGATVSDVCDSTPTLIITGVVDSHTPGDYTITYSATDHQGNTSTKTRTVQVQDTTAPVITLNPSQSLWPPNHKYVAIVIANCIASVTDACAGTIPAGNVLIESASSDEVENAQGNGDGNTLNDIVIASDGKSVQLRAERQGSGNGRVYTLNVAVVDPSGNKAVAACKVTVPHDQGAGSVAIDDGPAYSVTGLIVAKVVGAGGIEAFTGAAYALSLPKVFAMHANYPNPFNPATTIAYDVPQQAHVTLIVYNLLGQEVIRLVDEVKAPGQYSVVWNGRNGQGQGVSSGIYLYRIVSAGYAETRRMTLLK